MFFFAKIQVVLFLDKMSQEESQASKEMEELLGKANRACGCVRDPSLRLFFLLGERGCRDPLSWRHVLTSKSKTCSCLWKEILCSYHHIPPVIAAMLRTT